MAIWPGAAAAISLGGDPVRATLAHAPAESLDASVFSERLPGPRRTEAPSANGASGCAGGHPASRSTRIGHATAWSRACYELALLLTRAPDPKQGGLTVRDGNGVDAVLAALRCLGGEPDSVEVKRAASVVGWHSGSVSHVTRRPPRPATRIGLSGRALCQVCRAAGRRSRSLTYRARRSVRAPEGR